MIYRAMILSNPWDDLNIPNHTQSFRARRVDANNRWDFYWGRSTDRKCLLILKHDNIPSSPKRLPTIKGIELSISTSTEEPKAMLVFRLADSSHRDLFYRLCIDIVDAAGKASSEVQAVDIAITRTWRWHHLLRGGASGLLSDEQQKGLLGELLFLRDYMLLSLPPYNAVSAWSGPLNAPKDFEIGAVSIEVKTRRGAAKPYVQISSEHQLTVSDNSTLVLYVVEMNRDLEGTVGSFTLTNLARGIKQLIESTDQSAVAHYESRLAAAGFQWDHDYGLHVWSQGNFETFWVKNSFPRITSDLPQGVSDVKYSLSLVACEPYCITKGEVEEFIKGQTNEN